MGQDRVKLHESCSSHRLMITVQVMDASHSYGSISEPRPDFLPPLANKACVCIAQYAAS